MSGAPADVKPVVIVTRPDFFCDSTSDMFQEAGFETICEPMLSVRPVCYDPPDMNEYDAFIITSVTSFLFFDFQNRDFSKPIYCVGPVTAEKARDVGFHHVVVSPDGTAVGLVSILDVRKRYLHVCGTHVRYQFDDRFCDRLSVYITSKVQQFSSNFISFIKSCNKSVISFYSKRTAEAFVQCVRAYGDDSFLRGARALCIHQNVLRCVQELPWCDVYVSEHPNGKSVITCLKRM